MSRLTDSLLFWFVWGIIQGAFLYWAGSLLRKDFLTWKNAKQGNKPANTPVGKCKVQDLEIPCALIDCRLRKEPVNQAAYVKDALKEVLDYHFTSNRCDPWSVSVTVYGVPENKQEHIRDLVYAKEKEIYPQHDISIMLIVYTEYETKEYSPREYPGVEEANKRRTPVADARPSCLEGDGSGVYACSLCGMPVLETPEHTPWFLEKFRGSGPAHSLCQQKAQEMCDKCGMGNTVEYYFKLRCGFPALAEVTKEYPPKEG